jgi:RNA polymerase sigma-70 factor, ECF subfamily
MDHNHLRSEREVYRVSELVDEGKATADAELCSIRPSQPPSDTPPAGIRSSDERRVNDDRRADARLAERMRSGDTEALGELYDRYAATALAVALRVVGDRDEAEDIVHDVFVVVWRKIGGFNADRGPLRSWILTIVRNRAIDRIRARRPSMDLDDADERALLRTGPNPTWEDALRRASAADVRAALNNLPAEQRRAVELAYFDGYTYREVADLTGVPAGTANGRLRLALLKLRDALAPSVAAPHSALAHTASEEARQ